MPSSTPFCPLCFEALGDQHLFYVYNPTVKSPVPPIPATTEALENVVDEDRSFRDPTDGIFLAHNNCSRLNPFYVPEQNQIMFAASTDDERGLMRNQAYVPDTGTQVRHYEIDMLKKTRARYPEINAMWFPAMLMSAALGTESPDQTGRVAVLAGSQGVGKTVLSLQALHYGGFHNRLNSQHVHVRPFHYAYAPKGERFAELVNVLQAFQNPGEAVPNFKPKGTPLELGELRAIFYRVPSARARGKSNSRPSFWRELLDLLPKGGNSERTDWRTVVFYDAAGELFAQDAGEVRRLVQIAHHVGLVVQARSLLPSIKVPADLHVACRSVDRLEIHDETSWSVVVTKADEIRDKIDAKLWEEVEQAAETPIEYSEAGVPQSPGGEPIRLLRQIMGNSPDVRRTQFLQYIENANIPPDVFFIWTENLLSGDGLTVPTAPEIAKLENSGDNDVPVSFGLGKFISRCLGVPLDVINFVKRKK